MAKPGLFARLSRWFYRRKYGSIRDAAERTATHPAIVAALGPEKAREVVYREYGTIIGDPITARVRGTAHLEGDHE